MKSFGLLLMMLNHLVAPFLSPFTAVLTGELARHGLIVAFMDSSRFREDNYWKHARRLSVYLGFTVLFLAGLQFLFETHSWIQIPLAWLALLWVRPFIMRNKPKFAFYGFVLWFAIFGWYIVLRNAYGVDNWINALNLIAAGLVFPWIESKVKNRMKWYYALGAIFIYMLGSITSFGMGAKSQLDLIIVGFPLLLVGASMRSFLDKVNWLPQIMVKHSLITYVSSIVALAWIIKN